MRYRLPLETSSYREIRVDTGTSAGLPLRALLDAGKVDALLKDIQAHVPEVAVDAWLTVPVEG